MNELTDEQREALKDPGRITVIEAGPGAGKTRVFVNEFQQQLRGWSRRNAGIAALSFTNVARDEIAHRLGGIPPWPHFIGTLDAFVWRFIIRPFSQLAGVSSDGPRLIPDPLHKQLDQPSIKVGPNNGDNESIFRLEIRRANAGLSVFRPSHYARDERLGDSYVQRAMEAKRREWARTGRLTHSDAQYVASELFCGPHRNAIVERIACRFPVILVDEFQDTNRSLSEVVLGLLSHESVTGFIVGDRDQSIFAFGGIDKTLFGAVAKLSGSPSRPLRKTGRFGHRIAEVATALARSGSRIVPADGNSHGKVILVSHDVSDRTTGSKLRTQLTNLLAESDCENSAFLVRRNAWLSYAGNTRSEDCPLSDQAAQRLHRAACLLHKGDTSRAAELAGYDLGQLVLGEPRPTQRQILAAGIHPPVWKAAVRRLLFCAADCDGLETWTEWLARAKCLFQSEVKVFKPEVDTRKLGGKFRCIFRGGAEDSVRQIQASVSAQEPWEALTTHGAKGREFDGVVLFWPKPGGKVLCPSAEWWSENPESEEKEVAYVAVTRAKKLLVLCLHDDSVQALKVNRPDFYSLFKLHEAGQLSLF